MSNIYGDSITKTGAHVSLYVSKEDKKKLEAICNELDYNISDAIRILIQGYQLQNEHIDINNY